MCVCMYVVECSRTCGLLLLYFVLVVCTVLLHTRSKRLGRRQRKKPSLGLTSEFGGPPIGMNQMRVWQNTGPNISRNAF